MAVGQQNIEFIYNGSDRVDHDSVVITSMQYPGRYSESKHLKVYYTDQRTLDTLRSYISHGNYIRGRYTSPRKNEGIDTLKLLDVYKITGADAHPLFADGIDCFKLFLSAKRYLQYVGLARTTAWNAMSDMIFQCHEEFLHRNEISNPTRQIIMPRITDSPRIMTNPNN